MGVLFGGLSALFYGVADFLGGEGAKRAPAAAVVLWAGVFSAPVIILIALTYGGTASVADYLTGAAAGAAGTVGLVFLFAGLGRGRAAAVAPASAVLTAVIPVAAAVVMGESPSSLAWLGVVIAIPAIMLCSWVADPGEVPFGGLRYGLIAGLGFGSYNVIINLTSDESKLLPLITARGSTMAVVLLLSLFGVWKVGGLRSVPRGIVVGSGVLDVGGNVALLIGLRAGSLALVSVSSALYPAVTVIMARVINNERLLSRQVLGLVLTLVAMAIIAVG